MLIGRNLGRVNEEADEPRPVAVIGPVPAVGCAFLYYS